MSEKIETTLIALGFCVSVLLQLTGAVFLVACSLSVLEIRSIFDRNFSNASAWHLFLAAVASEVVAHILAKIAGCRADTLSGQASSELREIYRRAVGFDR
jgi:hypothetical protein